MKSKFCISLSRYLLLVALMAAGSLRAQTLSTIAGDGSTGYGGDGVAATTTGLTAPWGIGIDAAGNLYIGDYGNNRVRKISTAGIITTFAGTGSVGFSGDGGPATDARFNGPEGIVVDDSGNVYIVDNGNDRIRKVNTSGIISTVAGNGGHTFSGDGGPATAASLFAPDGMGVDRNGNIYICDAGNHRVRMVNTAGIITTIAGNGTAASTGDGGPATDASVWQPCDIAVDRAGLVYFSQFLGHKVSKIDAAGIITTVAGTGTGSYGGDDGPATDAMLNKPSGLHMDSVGNLYISDWNNMRIRKVYPSGIIITLTGDGARAFAGDGGPASAGEVDLPNKVITDKCGNVLIADRSNGRIRKISYTSHAPHFVSMADTVLLCENGAPVSIDSYLRLNDIDTAQQITYFLISSPHVGVTGLAQNVYSTGSTIVTSGVMVSPSTGYTGVSVMDIRAEDCYAYGEKTITFIVRPAPVAGAITGRDTICVADTTRMVDTMAGGTWVLSNSALATVNVSGLLMGVGSGNETVMYVVTSDCGSDTAFHTVYIKSHAACAAGVAELGAATGVESLMVYPNPNSGTFTLKLATQTNGPAQGTLVNMMGEKVRDFVLTPNKDFEMQAALSPGVYFIEVQRNGSVMRERVVVW